MDKLFSLLNTVLQSKALKIPKWVLVLIILCGFLGVPTYVEYIVKKGLNTVLEDKEMSTAQLMAYRAKISSKIDSVLTRLSHRTDSDRAFLGEYSNTIVGASGMHFLYFTINNEYTKAGVDPIGNDYQKQNFSNFKFNSYLVDHKVYGIKNIDTLKNSDPITYAILKKNKAKQLFLMYFEIDNIPIGFIGVSYTKKLTDMEDNQIFYEISKSMRQISNMFDFKEFVLKTNTKIPN